MAQTNLRVAAHHRASVECQDDIVQLNSSQSGRSIWGHDQFSIHE